ncbi:MAG: DUF11 domain-containing protein [Pirellulales bacterium]|nr:DUF11 domain-containing protein [Pirellulales bacterium]
MKTDGDNTTFCASMPRFWRWGLVVLCTLILCSCRAPAPSGSPGLPPEAFAGAASPAAAGCPEDGAATACPCEGIDLGTPLPYALAAPWTPPGIAGPWPEDEYLCDGGDRDVPVGVAADWQMRGLDSEDTVAHFDTLDGRTLVERSNRVCLYAPRFGSVRQVVSMVQGEQIAQPGGVGQPMQAVRCDELQMVASSKQQIEPVRQNSTQPPVIYRTKLGDGALSNVQKLDAFQDAFQPYENLKIIREGTFLASERARLAEGIAAAIIWTDTESVQIILDRQSAAEDVRDQNATAVYAVDQPPACPRLRIVKVASTRFAEPGDTVDFTLRFDNVGNQPIGNVTIVDSLTTRLEYAADSAQSSLPAQFSAQPNEAGSDVLRWEITDPLPVGEGGIVRFRCRVR